MRVVADDGANVSDVSLPLAASDRLQHEVTTLEWLRSFRTRVGVRDVSESSRVYTPEELSCQGDVKSSISLVPHADWALDAAHLNATKEVTLSG